jgi:ABC-type amino acid transport substrate-binding protein
MTPLDRKRIGALLLVSSLILTACGSQATPTPQPTAPPQPTEVPPTITSEPTEEPAPPPTPAPEKNFSSDRAKEISARGTLQVGVRNNSLPPFITVEGGHSGFEVELTQAIIEWLFEGQVTAEWVGVATGDRFSALADGSIDILVRNTTHTLSREADALWSDPYFIAGLRLLVREGEGISGLSDLDGRGVSVVEGTATQTILAEEAANAGVDIKEVAVTNNDEALAALANGDADAFFADWLYLLFTTQGDPAYQTVGELYDRQPIAIGIPLGEEDFREDINRALRAIAGDGTYEAIYSRWFPEPPPWTMEEMLNALPK